MSLSGEQRCPSYELTLISLELFAVSLLIGRERVTLRECLTAPDEGVLLMPARLVECDVLGSLTNRAFGLSDQSATVTRKKVAGMDVASSLRLLFWLLNRTSSSFCRSAARPFFSAASNAFMVGP